MQRCLAGPFCPGSVCPRLGCYLAARQLTGHWLAGGQRPGPSCFLHDYWLRKGLEFHPNPEGPKKSYMTHPWLQLASGLKCWALWGVHFGRYPLAVVGPDYTCHVVGGGVLCPCCCASRYSFCVARFFTSEGSWKPGFFCVFSNFETSVTNSSFMSHLPGQRT